MEYSGYSVPLFRKTHTTLAIAESKTRGVRAANPMKHFISMTLVTAEVLYVRCQESFVSASAWVTFRFLYVRQVDNAAVSVATILH